MGYYQLPFIFDNISILIASEGLLLALFLFSLSSLVNMVYTFYAHEYIALFDHCLEFFSLIIYIFISQFID